MRGGGYSAHHLGVKLLKNYEKITIKNIILLDKDSDSGKKI